MAVLRFIIYGTTSLLSEGSASSIILFLNHHSFEQNSCSLDDLALVCVIPFPEDGELRGALYLQSCEHSILLRYGCE